MAKEEELRNEWAPCLRAAACAGWWTLLVGVLILLATGVIYIIIVHTPLHEAVAMIWGVSPKAVTVVMVVFIGLYKMILLVGLLECVFLTALAHRLRPADEAE